jgi:hypothetical protein
MRTPVSAIPALLALGVFCGSAVGAVAAQAPAPTDCRETAECRQLALDAAAGGAYERFHDLVWRAIQTGKPNDPALLFLLARAQSLSNRPSDALVVLRRLADMGATVDASHEDLRRVRALAGWPAVAAAIERANSRSSRGAAPAPASPPAPAAPAPAPAASASAAAAPPPARAPEPKPAPPDPAVAPSPSAPAPAPPAAAPRPAAPRAPAAVPPPAAAAPTAAVATAPPVVTESFERQLVPAEEAARFSTTRFNPGGLAYDEVSRRFLLGDRDGRKLMVVGEGTQYTVDMVRAESAGFHDVSALDIDRPRGDLWVVTSRPDGAGTLHKLQLISGRVLSTFESPAEMQPVRFADVAVTAAGSVLVLDSAGQRIVGMRPRAEQLAALASLDIVDTSSLAPADNERIVYVAHREGIAIVDLTARTAVPLKAAAGVALGGFERIRFFRGALVGVQALEDGARRIVRLELNRNRTTVTRGVIVEESLASEAGPTFATITGDDLYYLEVVPPNGSAGTPDSSSTPGMVDIAVRRIRLR